MSHRASAIMYSTICCQNVKQLREVLGRYPSYANAVTENGFGDTTMHTACRYVDSPDIVLELLRHGANPVALNDYHRTPLMEACRSGRLETVRVLLRIPSVLRSLEHRCYWKCTALWYACCQGSAEIVYELLSVGASYECKNICGKSLRAAAQSNGSESHHFIEHLLKTAENADRAYTMRRARTNAPPLASDSKASAVITHAAHQLVDDTFGELLEYLDW